MPVLAPSSIGEAIALMADAFELAEKYRTPVFILADGTLGQAMEPVELQFREPPRLAAGWARPGADGRPPRVVKSMHLEPEDLEIHNRHLQAKFAEISGPRGPLGEREPRRRGPGDRGLWDRRTRRADGDRAGPR